MKQIKLKWAAIISAACIILAFFAGRMTINTQETVKVTERIETLPEINLKQTVPEPVQEIAPDLSQPTQKVIYIDRDKPYPVIQWLEKPIDSLEVVGDYFTKRQYRIDLFNDTLGKGYIDLEIEQNKLLSSDFHMVPFWLIREKERTIIKQRGFVPWVMLGSSLDFKTNKIQAGFDLFSKYKVGASVMRFDDKFGYTIDLGINF
jgi:hypothetical protein